MSNSAKSEALEKKHGKCKCGKAKGHEGKHREKGADLQKVEYEKKGKVRDEQESEAEEEEDDQ